MSSTHTKAAPASAPALPVDLASLSDDDLALLTVEAPRELERRKAKREAELFAFIREQATVLGLTPARLRAALTGKAVARTRTNAEADGRSIVAPLYRNPANAAQTWAGRGKPPEWIEFGSEINPKTGKPLPLRKFWISEQDKQGKA
jgi:DNA-binding protein H-NS